jgi:nitrogen regulatory protein PII
MESCADNKEFELICVIVNYGLGSDIIKFSKQHGITGGTIFYGKGTIKNAFLEFLDLAESRKEIVLMAAEATTAHTVLVELNKKFKFCKPNHGIAFTTSIMNILGTDNCTWKVEEESRGVANLMYNVIVAIVDRGRAESVIEAATEAGSKGGTIINARGSGIHETSKLFSMEIEPEREIVLIISEKELTEKITESINNRLEMNEPGNGIIFVQDVNKTYGLY